MNKICLKTMQTLKKRIELKLIASGKIAFGFESSLVKDYRIYKLISELEVLNF